MKCCIFVPGILSSAFCYDSVLSNYKRGTLNYPTIKRRSLANSHKPLTYLFVDVWSKFSKKSNQELWQYKMQKTTSFKNSRFFTLVKTSFKFIVLLHCWRNELIPFGKLISNNSLDAFLRVLHRAFESKPNISRGFVALATFDVQAGIFHTYQIRMTLDYTQSLSQLFFEHIKKMIIYQPKYFPLSNH